MDEQVIVRRQRLAWAVLLASFAVCVVITIAVPVTASTLVRNATLDLLTTVQANQGTVRIEGERGVRRAVIAGDAAQTVVPTADILTDATASALMSVHTPEEEALLARITVDSNSSIRLQRAATPRFSWSSSQQSIALAIDQGRVRLTLLETAENPIMAEVTTPHGSLVFEDTGNYTIEVTNAGSQVAVLDGSAKIANEEGELILAGNQRAEIHADEAPRGPLSPQQNLIENGDFSDGFSHWAEYTWRIEREDQPRGKTQIISAGGEYALRFERSGIGHADARVVQSLNRAVAGYDSLLLSLTLRVVDQSLGVCGVQGSECPLFVRINYVDESGVSQIWQHGFYAAGEVDDNATPGACISCAVIQSNHEKVPLGQDYFFEVDLREELARQGALAPRFIENISLVSSGHSFITEVIDASLIIK